MKTALILLVIISPKLYAAFDHSHAIWGQVLAKYVEIKGPSSAVKYKDLKKRHQDLKQYTSMLQKVTKEEYQSFSPDEKAAFLINAFNSLTIELVLQNSEIKTIKDLETVLTSPWKKKFFTLFGEQQSLSEIENQVFNNSIEDPRLIFALASACRSCAPLRKEPFVGARLNQQLEDATQSFLSDKSRTHFDTKSRTLYISELLKKHKSALSKRYGSLQAFIAPRIAKTPEEQKAIESNDTKIVFLDLDWRINEVKR
jgi:hypothetical protein